MLIILHLIEVAVASTLLKQENLLQEKRNQAEQYLKTKNDCRTF
jgi:hypothetical protein